MHPKAEKLLTLFRSQNEEDQIQAYELLCVVGPLEPVLLLDLFPIENPWEQWAGPLPYEYRTAEITLQMIGWMLDAQDPELDAKVFPLDTVYIESPDYIPSSLTRLPAATIDFSMASVECIEEWKAQTHEGVFHHVYITNIQFLDVLEGWKFERFTLKNDGCQITFECRDVHAEDHLNRIRSLFDFIRQNTSRYYGTVLSLAEVFKWSEEFNIDILELGIQSNPPSISEVLKQLSKIERLWLPKLESIEDLDTSVCHPLRQLEWNRCGCNQDSRNGNWLVLTEGQGPLQDRLIDIGVHSVDQIDTRKLPSLRSITVCVQPRTTLIHPILSEKSSDISDEGLTFHHQGDEFRNFGEKCVSLPTILKMFPTIRSLRLGFCSWTPKWESLDWDSNHPIESITWQDSIFSDERERFLRFSPLSPDVPSLKQRLCALKVSHFRMNLRTFDALKEIDLEDNWINPTLAIERFPKSAVVRQTVDFENMFYDLRSLGQSLEERNHGEWWDGGFYPYKDLTSFRITTESECRAVLMLGLPRIINRINSRLYCIAYLIKHPEGLTYDFSRLLNPSVRGFSRENINWLIGLLSEERDFEILLRAVQSGLSLQMVKSIKTLIPKLIQMCKDRGEPFDVLFQYMPARDASITAIRSSQQTTLSELLTFDGTESNFRQKGQLFAAYIKSIVRLEGISSILEYLPDDELQQLCVNAKNNQQMMGLLRVILKAVLYKFNAYSGRGYVKRDELYTFAREHHHHLLYLLLFRHRRWSFEGFFIKLENRDVLVQTMLSCHEKADVLSCFDAKQPLKWSYLHNVAMVKWLVTLENIPDTALGWVQSHLQNVSRVFSYWYHGPYSDLNTSVFFVLLENGVQPRVNARQLLSIMLKGRPDIIRFRMFFDAYSADMDGSEPICFPVDTTDQMRDMLIELYLEGRVVLTGKVSIRGWIQYLLSNPASKPYVQQLLQKQASSSVDCIGWAAEEIHSVLELLSDSIERLCIGGTDIDELPETIRRFKSLRHLILFTNQLKDLPAWVAEFPELETVSVTNNPMDDVPLILQTMHAQKPNQLQIYSSFDWPLEITEQ